MHVYIYIYIPISYIYIYIIIDVSMRVVFVEACICKVFYCVLDILFVCQQCAFILMFYQHVYIFHFCSMEHVS